MASGGGLTGPIAIDLAGEHDGCTACVDGSATQAAYRGITIRTPQETTTTERHTEAPQPYETAIATTWGSRGITTDKPTPTAALLATAIAKASSVISRVASLRAERQHARNSCASSLRIDRRRLPL
ncbi:unnamed protein product [Prorocentrum cordatum]|uniref:Uncharacterized protein n=1 Tax=Prorocentrum cordatum TaxID=2364126 RepID=A0ABN9VKZ1_9DINO|nr:unnamed protein product [Polarella glacialis]